VTLSCQRNTLSGYFVNRAKRIFPLLWASSIALLLLLVFWGGASTKPLLSWFIGQVTIFQYYTPSELRPWGVGTPNGSLWTIPIEIQFYIVLPLLLYFVRKLGNWLLLVGIALSGIIYHVSNTHIAEGVLSKVINCSVLVYFPLFCLGVIAALHREKTRAFFSDRVWVFIPLYLVWWYAAPLFGYTGYFDAGNPAVYIGAPLLACAVFSAALSHRKVSSILRGNDVSYGLYVLHGPIINLMVESGLTGGFMPFSIALLATFLLAILSWKYIEKPALSFRKPAI
jgi:peptidoglycan/LPS O-acetylase OafA/YrhL